MFRFLLSFFLILSVGLHAQISPKREFRAVWVATVNKTGPRNPVFRPISKKEKLSLFLTGNPETE